MLAEDLTRRLSPEVLSRRPAVPVRSGYPPVGVYIASSLSLHLVAVVVRPLLTGLAFWQSVSSSSSVREADVLAPKETSGARSTQLLRRSAFVIAPLATGHPILPPASLLLLLLLLRRPRFLG